MDDEAGLPRFTNILLWERVESARTVTSGEKTPRNRRRDRLVRGKREEYISLPRAM